MLYEVITNFPGDRKSELGLLVPDRVPPDDADARLLRLVGGSGQHVGQKGKNFRVLRERGDCQGEKRRITSYNVCYTKLLRDEQIGGEEGADIGLIPLAGLLRNPGEEAGKTRLGQPGEVV